MISLFGLAAGFALLVGGANRFVRGASGLAARLGVPSIIVGLTVVAFGTSTPELAVSVTASMRGANDIALGNVLGSNIFNLLAVVGASALVAPLTVAPEILRRDWLASVGATALLLVFAFVNGEISRLDALCLLVFFLSLLVLQINAARCTRKCAARPLLQVATPVRTPGDCKVAVVALAADSTSFYAEDGDNSADFYTEESDTSPTLSTLRILCDILVGLACIVAGGQCAVTAASEIARQFGLSENLIGLTIVAIGTSLPELVTSVIATKHGENDIAIGNVIGSNLFNLLFILGVACLIRPIATTPFVVLDTLLLLAASLAMFTLAKKNWLGRGVGVALLLSYVGYAAWVVVR